MSKTLDLGAVTAYALAVKNGFTGTEAEWLASLKGADGVSPTAENIASALGYTPAKQADVDTLNQNLEWKHGSAIIGGAVSLPDEWTEALCCFHKNDFSSGTLQVHLMRSLIASVEGREFDGGFYINGTNYGGARCFATQSVVSFTLFYINGEDASQNSTMDVYYRC